MEVDGSDKKLPAFIKPYLNEIAIEQGFTEIHLKTESSEDDWISVNYKVVISGKINEKNCKKLVNVKVPPVNPERRVNSVKFFEREIFTYNNIFPAFMKFQNDSDLRFNAFPKCYLAKFDQEKDEIFIITKDVRSKGFTNINRFTPNDIQHARCFLTELGRFHAVSLAMKEKQPVIFDKFKDLNDSIGESGQEELKSLTDKNCSRALDQLHSSEEDAIFRLKQFSENIFSEIKKCTNYGSAEPYTVINHGDCSTSNILFRYKAGLPQQICLINWQVCRYSSPILDLVYYIFNFTDKSLRDKYYDNLLQVYYKSLREHIERLDGDPNELFPFTALLRQMKMFSKFGVAMAIFMLPEICKNDEVDDDGDVDGELGLFRQNSYSGKSGKEIYKQRMGDVVRDCIRLGYL